MSQASIINITCPDFFNSEKDNFLYSHVEIDNPTEYVHSSQVVFRGYVRKNNLLCYEFFHEQQWLLVKPKTTETHEVRIDAWLPRFPPTVNLNEGFSIEYAVRASIDPWFENNYVERIFGIKRTLTLKMPHIASFPIESIINKCVEHGNIIHRKCDPINGHVALEKGAFTQSESINVNWDLKMNKQSTIENYICKLVRIEELRISDPGNYMATKRFEKVISEQKTKMNFAELFVPNDCPISIPMSLWNVLSVSYEFRLDVKLHKLKRTLLFKHPIIICDEQVAKQKRPRELQKNSFFTRTQDVDDDSEDDDDYDSEDEKEHSSYKSYSTDIEKLEIIAGEKQIERAAQVTITMNSEKPEPLKSVRLLMTGETRVGANWYEFLRFKAIAHSSPTTLFSPGEHTLLFNLPFSDSQYDTSILPPTIGDEIKYIVRITTENLKKNVFDKECELLVDRFIDTWAKESFKPPYSEDYGATKIHMPQRCFKRGKHVIVMISGDQIKSIRGKLIQMRRLRLAGLKNDTSYCTERTVSIQEDNVHNYEHAHTMHIPYNIPPSIEVSYWNVVQINYNYDFDITLEGGHVHHHSVPIWIGCTEDNLEKPVMQTQVPNEKPTSYEEPMGELPPFEVVHKGDVREQPYWVERFNEDTYN